MALHTILLPDLFTCITFTCLINFLLLLHVIELERLRRVNDVDVGNDVLQILVRRHVSRR